MVIFKGTFIHEIGDNLGLDHHHNTNIMNSVNVTTINNSIGGSRTTYSYLNIDKKGIKIFINNANKPRVGSLGIIRTP